MRLDLVGEGAEGLLLVVDADPRLLNDVRADTIHHVFIRWQHHSTDTFNGEQMGQADSTGEVPQRAQDHAERWAE